MRIGIKRNGLLLLALPCEQPTLGFEEKKKKKYIYIYINILLAPELPCPLNWGIMFSYLSLPLPCRIYSLWRPLAHPSSYKQEIQFQAEKKRKRKLEQRKHYRYNAQRKISILLNFLSPRLHHSGFPKRSRLYIVDANQASRSLRWEVH